MSEQPQQLTEEDLKNMSPEEILALQKQNCIFCQIIEGKIPSNKVYEDNQFLVILDINPANPGHVLLLTKEHFAIMPQIPDEVVRNMGIVMRNLSNAIIKGLKVEGTSIFIANGPAAGQRANHFMAHIIPRIKDDGLFQVSHKAMPPEDITKLAAVLSGKPIDQLGPVEEQFKENESSLKSQKEPIEAQDEEIDETDNFSNEEESDKDSDELEEDNTKPSTDLDDISKKLGV